MNMKSVLMVFAVLLMCMPRVCAQAVEPVVVDSVAVEEVTITSRLQNPSAPIVVDAPHALWLRVGKADAAAERLSAEIADDDATDEKLESEATSQKVRSKGVGYRVQVFADNNARSAKTEARQREKSISGAFPQYSTYVTYASPFWRLRVGDFKSQYDADKAAAEIKRQFPGYAREVRVVRDRVNVK